MNQPKERNRFIISITTVPQEKNYPVPTFHSVNDGVPLEMVITQLKAFLHNLEQEYFKDVDEGSVKFGE